MADWANIQYDGESVGTLYYEDDRMGFIPVVTSPIAAPGYGAVFEALRAALISPLPAEDGYVGVLGVLADDPKFSYEEAQGESVEKPALDISGLNQAFADDDPSPYYVRLDEDDVVVSLTQESSEGTLVRENGQWVPITEDNYPDDEGTDYFGEFITEESVAEYDRIVSNNEAPTLDDLEAVAPLDD